MKKMFLVIIFLCTCFSLFSEETKSYTVRLIDSVGTEFIITDFQREKVFKQSFSNDVYRYYDNIYVKKGDSEYSLDFGKIKSIEFIGKLGAQVENYRLAKLVLINGNSSTYLVSSPDEHRWYIGTDTFSDNEFSIPVHKPVLIEFIETPTLICPTTGFVFYNKNYVYSPFTGEELEKKKVD